MFVLPKQLPKPDPDQGDDAPATVMSWKSTFDFVVYVVTVNVLAVPKTLDLSMILRSVLAPAATRVPIAWFPEKVTMLFPALAGAVIDKEPKVFAPSICFVPAVVDVKLTAPKVNPAPPSKITLVPDEMIVEEPALKVKLEPEY